MKKSLLLSVLGLAAATATSYGQGSIQFNTYTSHGGSGLVTTFNANAAPAYTGAVTPDFTAQLLYSLAPVVEAAGSDPISGAWTVAGGVSGSFMAGGYFTGPNFVQNPYTPGSQVYFQIVAYRTSDGDYNSALYRGKSAAFSQTLATGLELPGTMDNLQPFQVYLAIPEPSTLALAGLGLASLLVARRRK